MAKDKKSRLAEIYKAEKKKGGGVFSTLGKRGLEKFDPRQIFNQTGFLAAVLPSLFKAYTVPTASSLAPVNPLEPSAIKENLKAKESTKPSPLIDIKLDVLINETSDLKTHAKISAKNSLVLPYLARDMNVTRINIQKLVKLMGGTASKGSDAFFKLAGEREALYESQFKREKSSQIMPGTTPVKKEETGGLFGGIFSLLGKGISGAGSLLTGLLPSLSGFFGTLIKAIIGAGIFGLIFKNLDEDTKQKIRDFLKDMLIGAFNAIESGFKELKTLLIDSEVIKSLQSAVKSMIDAVVESFKVALGTEIETPLGKFNLGSILAATVGALATFQLALGAATAALGGLLIPGKTPPIPPNIPTGQTKPTTPPSSSPKTLGSVLRSAIPFILNPAVLATLGVAGVASLISYLVKNDAMSGKEGEETITGSAQAEQEPGTVTMSPEETPVVPKNTTTGLGTNQDEAEKQKRIGPKGERLVMQNGVPGYMKKGTGRSAGVKFTPLEGEDLINYYSNEIKRVQELSGGETLTVSQLNNLSFAKIEGGKTAIERYTKEKNIISPTPALQTTATQASVRAVDNATVQSTTPAAPTPALQTTATQASVRAIDNAAAQSTTPTKELRFPPYGRETIVIRALEEEGITDEKTQLAVLGNIKKETGDFVPKSEDLHFNTIDRIRTVFPTVTKNMSDEQLKPYLQNPQGLAELVYSGKMGNKEPGDGYKYRGRGFIQLTGKDNYVKMSKALGIDLINNPDLANDLPIAAKIAAKYMTNSNLKNQIFQSQEEANRAVTQAVGGPRLNLDKGIGAELLVKVNDYTRTTPTLAAAPGTVSTLAAAPVPLPDTMKTIIKSEAGKLNAATIEIAQARLQIGNAPIIVSPPAVNVQAPQIQAGGGGGMLAASSVVDTEFMKLLVGRTVTI